eukprot:GGOE01003854.1.p1 GENE.GGOE01003854.1~~GGOE01003854.1.p1  ORF type:complete len:662 (-),score=193.96 GGOE01003854.1:1013-2971(-)
MLPLCWHPTRASHSILHAFKFRNPGMEQDFQQQCSRVRVILATAYFAFSASLNVVHAASFYGDVKKPIAFWCFVLAAILPALGLIVLHALHVCRRWVVPLHAGITLVSILIFCYLSLPLSKLWITSAVRSLESSLSANTLEQVSGLLATAYSNQGRLVMVNACQFHLSSLAVVGYNHSTIPVWLCFISALILVYLFDPHTQPLHIIWFASELFLSLIPFLMLCISVEVLQRANYHANEELKRELEVSQTAETMLSTTVKNALADAAANIQEYLNAGNQAAESLLRETISGLARGMRCCRQRQAFLSLVSDTYEPHFLQVSLRDFGEELVAGRAVAGEFDDVRVLLDPLLVNLVMESAIAQAFQRGHPEGPDVRVRIFREELFRLATMPAHNAVQVVFEVSFICEDDEANVHNGSFLMRNLFPAHYMTHQHLRMAAEAHGMSTQWFREQDRITFQAACSARLAQPRPTSGPPKALLDAFPSQLNFYIIDDSSAARRLLASSITRTAAPAAVHCYGAAPQDVDQFVAAASLDGDVVICDQHLDYGDHRFLGSDLVRSLRDRGFQGLLCMRSADTDERDRELYHACGAHCVFGKEVLCREVVESIKAAYVELKGLYPAEDDMSRLSANPNDGPGCENTPTQACSSCGINLNWDSF